MAVFTDPAIAVLTAGGRLVAAILLANLPSRYWMDLDERFPVTRCALLSAVLVTVGGAAIAVHGYLSELSLTVLAFAVTTPAGWISNYLWWSGLLRIASAIAEDPGGDPLLTLIDTIRSRRKNTRRVLTDLRARRVREGPEVPDQLLRGTDGELEGAAVVVLASREKAGWRVGTTVVMGEAWYRVSRIDQRTVNGHLRTVYGLVPHGLTEVARDVVYYDAPV